MKENNKWKYQGDSRYEKVWANMQLLGIQDVTTDRQHKNGTIVWRLPILSDARGKYLEYASFSTGYVRNQGVDCHSNWQCNRRIPSDEYYAEQEWCNKRNKNVKTGKFLRFKTRTCELIPIEIDRLEYMLKYVIKNEFIKRANYVQEGKFVPKWRYEQAIDNSVKNEVKCEEYMDKLNLAKQNVEFHEQRANEYRNNINDVTVIIDGHKYKLI
jgi:hypothetical protein